jgi:hypothetical protein
MTTDTPEPGTMFAVDFAALAREIAMDIFPLEQLLELHRLTNDDWAKIQANPKFGEMVQQMVTDWAAATNTGERVRIKAATGLESTLEIYIRAILDDSIPLNQRVEAGKFLARLGELDGQRGADSGDGFHVTLNIGTLTRQIDVKPAKVIEAIPVEDRA